MSVRVGHTLLIIITIVFGIIIVNGHKHKVYLGTIKTERTITCKGPQTGPNGACPKVRVEHRTIVLPGPRTTLCDTLTQRAKWYAMEVKKHLGSRRTRSRKRALTSTVKALQVQDCIS